MKGELLLNSIGWIEYLDIMWTKSGKRWVGERGGGGGEESYILTLLICMADGAPGKWDMHVLKIATFEKEPLPQELIAHTRNLKAFPGSNLTFWTTVVVELDSIYNYSWEK